MRVTCSAVVSPMAITGAVPPLALYPSALEGLNTKATSWSGNATSRASTS